MFVWTLSIQILNLSTEMICLKMIEVIVPGYKIRGENALLECRFDLEKDLLYSVKWYRNNEEFYRFMPRQSPAQHSFSVEGIKVDVSFVIFFILKSMYFSSY